MNITLIAITLYVLLQFWIGWIVSRRITTEDDYLVAGRSLGFGVATFTIFATWFGAETCVGAAGRIYEKGLSGGAADPFGYAICLLIMGLFLAIPFRKRKLTTMADLFRLRYSSSVERLAVLLMAPTSLLWGAAQIRAFGQVISASSGLEPELTISLAALVVILYTMFGGLLADAWTDVVQGVGLIIGLIILFVMIFNDVGTAGFAAIDPARLNPFGGSGGVLEHIESWAIPICGSVMAAELVARIIAARTSGIARSASITSAGLYMLIGLIPVSIGLLGTSIIGTGVEAEHVLPMVAQHYMPGVLYAVFAGALISAILSTVDSALLVASSLVAHNVIVPLTGASSEKSRIRIARIGVALFGVIAYVMALYADGVYSLVEEASSFGSAGIFVVVLFALFSRFGRKYSALASLLLGVGVWSLAAYVFQWDLPYLHSLLAAFLGYVVVGFFEGRSEEVIDEDEMKVSNGVVEGG